MTNSSFIEKLTYSIPGKTDCYPLSLVLKDSFTIVHEYFKTNPGKNKLCIVFPSKELAAQWLAVPLTLNELQSDFLEYSDEIYSAHNKYRLGQKLLLNNKAVVEWVGGDDKRFTFKTKPTTRKRYPEQETSGDTISVKIERINNLKPAPPSRKLSPKKVVYENLRPKSEHPVDRLLSTNCNGNLLFLKHRICLVTKYTSFDSAVNHLLLNHSKIEEYFKAARIDDHGDVTEHHPLLLVNNFTKLILHLSQKQTISTIIIDGFNSVIPRGDFSDIDREFRIPFVLVTDLSELESFKEIRNHDFEFFNFTDEDLSITLPINGSPFGNFEKKFLKAKHFKVTKSVCANSDVEVLANEIHSLPQDDSDDSITTIRISLIGLLNILSRLSYLPTNNQILHLRQRIENIRAQYLKSRTWLGEAYASVEKALGSAARFVKTLEEGQAPEKCTHLRKFLQQDYNYIICVTDAEKEALRTALPLHPVQIISVSDVGDNLINDGVRAILIGWPKWTNMNRIITSFVFDELLVLFYPFENRYYSSLQRRNKENYENAKSTWRRPKRQDDDRIQTSNGRLFEDLKPGQNNEPFLSNDIAEYELAIDRTVYSRYLSKGNLTESCKAKRINFENETFLYATESHKFLIINDLIESSKDAASIQTKKYESLQLGDIIALIDTETDVLVEIVQKITKPAEFQKIKRWTDLWKTVLRDYFLKIGNNFAKLIAELAKQGCKRHPSTIRTWLQDDNRIGPEDKDDLLRIALVTESTELYDNIDVTRDAISQMTGWRMKASDLVRDRIRRQLQKIADHSIINASIEIPDLGRVVILKVNDLSSQPEEIDKRFVHRLLKKDEL